MQSFKFVVGSHDDFTYQNFGLTIYHFQNSRSEATGKVPMQFSAVSDGHVMLSWFHLLCNMASICYTVYMPSDGTVIVYYTLEMHERK